MSFLARLLASLLVSSALLTAHEAPTTVPEVLANDNRTPAGTLRNGVLTVRLEIKEAMWYPQQQGGPSIPVFAFSEEGKPPTIPGPLLRVPVNTEIRLSLRSRLSKTMFVRGLHNHADEPQSVELPAGTVKEVRFTPARPGSYFYSARSVDRSVKQLAEGSIVDSTPEPSPYQVESQLSGAIVVDRPGGTSSDRVFVISMWDNALPGDQFREIPAINGKAWPHTERLHYGLGDTARWRVINTSVSAHAMHLHGFFFRVTSRGEKSYGPQEQPLAVTEFLPPGGTVSLEWLPERQGRWIFHCHMLAHMSDHLDLNLHPLDANAGPSHAEHSAEGAGMGGLVLGIEVTGNAAAASTSAAARSRRIKLLVRERPAAASRGPGFGYSIQEDGKDVPAVPTFPGPPLVLSRGEPVEIEVVNQLRQETVVHWHGIELESYYDGVPMWGGTSRQMTPPIAPGGTFVARMAPPRAGTYIYHTHWHDVKQLTGGLYGPLLVLEPGQQHDPETDKVFIIGRAGPNDEVDPLVVNGSPQPIGTLMRVGKRYRLRFINITPNNVGLRVSLLRNGSLVEWRALAKDGADLPPVQALHKPATTTITVGETYDFEFIPQTPGELSLEVMAPFFRAKLTQAIVVR